MAADEQNEPEVVVPDNVSDVATPRFLRKEAQHRLIHALNASKGRSGLSDAEKLEGLKYMLSEVNAAALVLTQAVALLETGEVPAPSDDE